MMEDWHIYDAHAAGIKHGNIIFWTSMIREIIPRHTGKEVVLDYGCGEGQFLRLLNQIRPFASGIGVDVDQGALEKAKAAKHVDEPIAYDRPESLQGLENHFDYIFSQEIFWMIEDLPALAQNLHRLLKNKGEYYATMGCHIENPMWAHRRQVLKQEGVAYYDYSLDEVADIFHAAGFEVGLKRLPVTYFNIYHPEFTRRRSQSLSRLVETTHDHKMLFYFRRDDEMREKFNQLQVK